MDNGYSAIWRIILESTCRASVSGSATKLELVEEGLDIFTLDTTGRSHDSFLIMVS